MAISSTLITTAGVDIFLCPGTAVSDEREYAVTCMIFCNYAATDVVLSELYAVPTGDVIANKTTIIKDLTIPAGETFTFDTEKLVLSTGDLLHAVADANTKLTVTVSSMRVS
jgi:hypothetical protein